jgi:hypothetical protein
MIQSNIKENFRQFNKVIKIDQFKTILEKLTIDTVLDEAEKKYILTCAIIFLEQYKKDKRNTSLLDFAYYVILKYSITYKDYQPLFDFAINIGYYPIAKIILKNKLIKNDNINDFLINLNLENFNNGYYYETFEQNTKKSEFLLDNNYEKSFIAPTSYGKSSVIIDCIKKSSKSRIVIVVPTKSLLSQTYKMIRENKLDFKILIHDEMYENEKSFIAIFTQERALRLLSKHNTNFDMMFIDEAHNLLNNNSRSILLSRLISKNKFLNNKCEIIYLSPLIYDSETLKINHQQEINSHKIVFNVKEPEIFEFKLDKSVYKHNRFFINKSNENPENNFEGFKIGLDKNCIEYMVTKSRNKNFLYTYRPKIIENLALDLSKNLPKIQITPELRKLIKILEKEVHPNFYCVNLLEYGIIYLHGKIPDIIKEFLELKFKELPELKYVVANSVILEGINLPIDTLFILSTYNLRGKELTNLIGRVNRLNEIFNSEANNLDKLLPNIHFVNNVEYSTGENMFNKITLLRSRFFKDEIKNPVLANFDINSIKDSDPEKQDEKRKKVEEIKSNEILLLIPTTNFKEKLQHYFIESGINVYYHDIDLLVKYIDNLYSIQEFETIEWKELDLLERIGVLFLNDSKNISNDEFRRMEYKQTRDHYKHHILINQKKSLNENIISLYKHFKEKSILPDEKKRKFYFGTSYGEEVYDIDNYPNSYKKVYIDLGKVTDKKVLINLAIIKLKMEDDFIGFTLNKFIVFLYDFNLITTQQYHLYVYGTTNVEKIKLTKFGLSISLISRLEENNQLTNLYFDKNKNLKPKRAFNKYLNKLNDFERFEIERFIN